MSNVAEVLYYRLYNSVLLGNKDDAKLNLDLLREEYRTNKEEFVPLQEDERWDHLVELGEAVDNGKIITSVSSSNSAVIPADERKVDKEKELVTTLMKNQNLLREALHTSPRFYISNSEHPTKFGRADLVAIDDKTLYVIETKRGTADFGVVGQLDKYMLHFKLKLILRVYTRVVGVIIANGFNEYAVQELRRPDITLLKYSYVDGHLSIKNVSE